ncbi:DUF3857 domain-containing protein [Salegentibacter sp. F188]|uniref:DUF3857 domain-containing protein n=1 Tax=Autumnicola patrickiae TaxID=3075591 RepID=A0ABU3DZG6_9FLAO|nr:DUF3857 domain-containing protein [Salegentibacter sp. F188]MDT0689111.1 DUF3857 domain-containing protein [Salegentibacter sp. F188]
MKLKRKFAFIVLLTFLSTGGWAQKYKLDKLSERDFEIEKDTSKLSSPAVFLIKHRETYFDYSDSDHWTIINEVTERIHILSKEGLDYATKKIPLYKNDTDKEILEEIEGATYNLEGGKVEKTKFDEKVVFEKNINKHWNESVFTMPNARVGSVVEWSYKTISPFWKVDDLVLQQDIPVKHYYAKIRTPQMFGFRVLKRGSFEISPNSSVESRSLGFTYAGTGGYGTSTIRSNSARVNFQEIISEYQKENIPALKEEPFVNNINNYRYSIIYELTSTEFSEGNVKNYAITWEEVARSIFKSKNFGKQLEDTRFLKEAAKNITSQYVEKEIILEKALELIKLRMTWNGEYGKYVEQDISKAYKNGAGNVAEINLSLIALLRECGLDVNPVLVSTQSNGVPLYPTLEGYNYVIAGLRENGKTLLLDATEKWSAVNILPARVYNWTGRMISDKGIAQEIDLNETSRAEEYHFVMAAIDNNGVVTGEVKERFVGNKALNYRQKKAGVAEKDIKSSLAEGFGLQEIIGIKVKNSVLVKEPIEEIFQFTSSNEADVVGNKIYFSPLLFLKLAENPFKEEFRQFPVNYINPFTNAKMVTLSIPEGYKVASIPQSLNMVLPDDTGAFLFHVAEQNGTLQITSRFSIKKPYIDAGYYESLREFYKRCVEKENEKIVLEKV